MTVPSPSLRACSTASASRPRWVDLSVGHRLEPVDDGLDVVLDLPVERQVVGQADDLPLTRARTYPARDSSAKRSLYSPFWPRTTGASSRNDVPAGSFFQNPRHDLLAGLGRHGPAAVGAMPLPDPGKQHAQIIVDLGDRADGRPRVAAAGLLLDRDRRAQPVDPVDLGLGHLPQELPGVAREALDVAALPFGIKRVERQRALARARDAGQADQLARAAGRSETSRRLCSRAPRITMSDAIPARPSAREAIVRSAWRYCETHSIHVLPWRCPRKSRFEVQIAAANGFRRTAL